MANLRVVHAHALRETDLMAAQVRVVQKAETYLAGVERYLAAEGVSTSSAVRYGEPVAKIVDDILTNRPDLVGMSTHGQTGLFHLIMGSVAEQVLRVSPVPVLLFPARPIPPMTLAPRGTEEDEEWRASRGTGVSGAVRGGG